MAELIKSRKVKVVRTVIVVLCIALVASGVWAANAFNLIPARTYTAADFGIEQIKSSVDFNDNGVDDYTDIMLGARKDAENHPTYDGSYVQGGYPDDSKGVCTDVVWRGFKEAGYSLRDMLDRDIAAAPEAYTRITEPDSNIDFRRVQNLKVFFDRHAVSLTTDPDDIDQWQPGDIVLFNGTRHIGIVSDKRDSKGRAYIIHNANQPEREENYFKRAASQVSAHYRFDASEIDESILVSWDDRS